MQTKSQEIATPTPRRIFPLSPEMVRQLRGIATSSLQQVPVQTQAQQQVT